MDREIKFRSWVKEKQELIYDFGIVYNSTFQENEKRILMQYTGLKDRYDNDIYEGDYVIGINRITEEEREQKVTFLNGCFMFGNWNAHEYFNKHTEIFISGNIYENPKSLEKRGD